MRALIENTNFFGKIDTNKESELNLFLRDFKQRIYHDFLYRKSMVIERVEVELVDSRLRLDNEGYVYKGTFQVVFKRTGFVYDEIHIELKNVSFWNREFDFDSFFKSFFQLILLGYRTPEENINLYSMCIKKTLDFSNRNVLKLKNINEMPFKEGETEEEKIERVSMILEKVVTDEPFEVIYSFHGEQSYLYLYDENEHLDFIKRIIKSTKTHSVSIRLFENPLRELQDYANGQKRTTFIKKSVS